MKILFFLLVTKNFLVKVQLSKAAIFSCRLTARMLEKRDKRGAISVRRRARFAAACFTYCLLQWRS